MYRLTVSHFNRVFHAFADGWVRMNAIEYFMVSSFQLARCNSLRDDLSYVVTDGVCAKPFAILCIKDHFDEAFGMSGSRGFTRCAEREFANFDLITGFFRLFLCEAGRSYFRIAISTTRNVIIINRFRLMIVFLLTICDSFNTDDAFF